MKRKKGFTLVELLAVVVVLGITLVIAVPKIMNTMEAAREKALSSSAKKIAVGAENEYLERKTYGDVAFLNAESIPCNEFIDDISEYENCEVSFTKGRAFVKLEGKGKFDGKYICVGTKEEARVQSEVCNLVTMAEEKLIIAAKDYAKYVDASFSKNLKNVGDKNYIYKTDLLKEELISEVEVSRLDTFSGVKGELLDNKKVDYSIEYINADPSEYTVEELYTMFQSLNDRMTNVEEGNTGSGSGGVDSSVIDDLQSQINNNATTISNLTNKSSNDNVFLKTYPVGSVYVSTSSTNPGSTFGGTWESFGTGRTLVGVDTSQTEFATVEKTGGEKTHTLTVDEMPIHNHTDRYYIQGASGWSLSISNDYTMMVKQGTFWFGDDRDESILGGSIGYNNAGSTINNVTILNGPQTLTAGKSFAHNNLQPYITVYMWKRTA